MPNYMVLGLLGLRWTAGQMRSATDLRLIKRRRMSVCVCVCVCVCAVLPPWAICTRGGLSFFCVCASLIVGHVAPVCLSVFLALFMIVASVCTVLSFQPSYVLIFCVAAFVFVS
eukprot:Opistho-2@59090